MPLGYSYHPVFLSHIFDPSFLTLYFGCPLGIQPRSITGWYAPWVFIPPSVFLKYFRFSSGFRYCVVCPLGIHTTQVYKGRVNCENKSALSYLYVPISGFASTRLPPGYSTENWGRVAAPWVFSHSASQVFNLNPTNFGGELDLGRTSTSEVHPGFRDEKFIEKIGSRTSPAALLPGDCFWHT